jgi:hypothetical protein
MAGRIAQGRGVPQRGTKMNRGSVAGPFISYAGDLSPSAPDEHRHGLVVIAS